MEEEKKKLDLEANEETLLNYLVDNRISVVEPVIYHDRVDYDILKDFVIKDEKDVRVRINVYEILESLTAKKFFDKVEHDRVIHCPKCGSINKHTKYSCPQCLSIQVMRHELVEHINCGYIGEIKEFHKKESGMVCPKCKKKLKNEPNLDYDSIGISYECENCGYKFDKPDSVHLCMNCGNIYGYKNSNYVAIYSYTLTDRITEITPVREIRDIMRVLETCLLEKGYQAELEAILEGKSGEQREFDIAAAKNGKTIIIDVSPWGKDADMTALLGKKMDLEPSETIIMSVVDSEKLTQLGRVYGIKVMNGRDPKLRENFLRYLDNLEVEEKPVKGRFKSPFK